MWAQEIPIFVSDQNQVWGFSRKKDINKFSAGTFYVCVRECHTVSLEALRLRADKRPRKLMLISTTILKVMNSKKKLNFF